MNKHEMAIVDKLPTCDFCGKPAYYDAKTNYGPWANMCTVHYKLYGIGLGLGKGQELVESNNRPEDYQ